MRTSKRKITGYIIAAIGSLMVLFSALNYIIGWNLKTTTYSAIGIVNIAVGMGIVKKSK